MDVGRFRRRAQHRLVLAAPDANAEEFQRRLDPQRLALDAHLPRLRVEGDVLELSDPGRPLHRLAAGGLRGLFLSPGGRGAARSGSKRKDNSRYQALIQRLGLEWAFRLAAEPRRLWRRYLVHNPRFVGLMTLELARAARRRRSAGEAVRSKETQP